MNYETLLLKLLNQSLTGSVVILFILVFRLLLKRLPKKYLCMLWLIPFFRLLVSIWIPSPLSLFPVNPTPVVEMEVQGGRVPALNTGIEAIDMPVNLILIETMSPVPGASAPPAQIYGVLFTALWAIGFALLLGSNLFRYQRLKQKLADSIPGESRIYYSDQSSMPMVLGILKPRIYLPSMFLKEEYCEEKQFVLEHELAHIRRRDHLAKPIAFFALAVHWFNPLVWAAYLLLCRDMEMACDEAVMEKMGTEKKKGYSLALLHFQERQDTRLIPLAFGESHTKARIKNILNYKKPKFWINLAAVLLLVFAVHMLMTKPQEAKPSAADIDSDDSTASISSEENPGGEDQEAQTVIIGGADGPTSIFLAGKLGKEPTDSGAEEIDLETVRKEFYGTGVELDFVSASKISMHGYFGYLVFSFSQDETEQPKARLLRAVTLSETGQIFMQGDPYTEIIGGDGAAIILPGNGDPYIYYEEDNTIEKVELEDSSPQSFLASVQGGLADAPVEEDLRVAALTAVQKEFGEGNSILYGPVAVPEFDSNVYGFLATDGENVEDIWYGLWWEDFGWVKKIILFP